MGKLENKIRKRIQAGQEDFGTWFEKHGDDFPGAGFAAEPEERGVFIDHAIWEKPLKEIAAQRSIPYITLRQMYGGIKKKIGAIYSQS